MKSIILGLLLLSANALAQTADMVEKNSSFFYTSSRSYYACSYAESRAKNFIKEMGGEVVKIRCTGGLPDFSYVDVDMTYRAAVTGVWKSVSLRGNESCEFNTKLIESLIPNFKTQNMVAREFCNDSSGRYQYTFEALVTQ
jgi:hypothetical protein